jgi:hypothetical protein
MHFGRGHRTARQGDVMLPFARCIGNCEIAQYA